MEDIKQIEQHKYHPKENDVEYYSNHMIYKTGEHKPKKLKFLNHSISDKSLLLMLLVVLEYLDENKNYVKHQKYLFPIELISKNEIYKYIFTYLFYLNIFLT